MPRALSRRAGALRPSAIRKLDAVAAARPDVQTWRLNIGQPDVAPPRPVREAIARWAPEVIGYGPASGLPGTREAVAGWLGSWSGGALAPADLAITHGASEALLFALAALADPGDEVIVFAPFYPNYHGFAATLGLQVREVGLSLADGFALPPDPVLDAAVTPRSRVVLLSNPSNPTGAVWGEAALRRLLAWAARHDLWVLSDEVYRTLYEGSAPVSALAFPEHADRVVVADSLSKAWSLCGLRCGWVASRNAEIMERIEVLGQARLGPQPLAQVAAEVAVGLDAGFYEEVRQTYGARIDALHEAVASISGVRTHRPEGAFYLYAELPVDDVDAFARWMVADFQHRGETLMVAPGTGFRMDPASGRSEVRLAAVLQPERLRRAAEVLDAGLSAWRAQRGR